MSLIARLEAFSHRKCKTAMSHMRADLLEMNADRAQMARNLVETRKYADQLAEENETLKQAAEDHTEDRAEAGR